MTAREDLVEDEENLFLCVFWEVKPEGKADKEIKNKPVL